MSIHRYRLKLLALTLIIYAYFCNGYVNNVSMNAIADATIAMVDNHTLQIDPYASNSNDIDERAGHYYSGFAPGLSFLLVPVYVVLKPALALVPERVMARMDQKLSDSLYARHGSLNSTNCRTRVMILVGVGTLLIGFSIGILAAFEVLRVSRRLLPHLSEIDLSWLALLTSFGSIMMSFTIQLAHTSIAAWLVWIAVARALCEPARRSAKSLLLCGALIALAPTIDYPGAIYGGFAALFTLYLTAPKERLRVVGLMAAGGVAPIAASLSYHRAAFGSALTNSYRFRARAVDKSIFDVHHAALSLPNAAKLYVGFLHPYSGLVLYHPLLLVSTGLLGYFFVTERERVRKAFWALGSLTAIVNVFIYCSYPLEVGPASGPIFAVRYTAYSTPFALVAIAMLLSKLPVGHWGRKALAVLALANAIPVWAFALYGSPVFPARNYGELFAQLGPASYTLTKLHEARLLMSPIWGWLGTALIATLLVSWWRAAARLLEARPKNLASDRPA